MANMLLYGDNLDYLRELPSGSIDLIYLDPPFNSNASYNLLFKSKGNVVEAQTTAFTDTWSWLDRAEIAFNDVMASGSSVSKVLGALRSSFGTTNLMAYLSTMSVRLLEMHRLLKPTGSLYLHCDPTASHYLKVILDGIFGVANFRNDIVWKRTTTHNDSKTWSKVSDNILFYTSGKSFVWNTPRESYSQQYLSCKYRFDDGDGRTYSLDNMTSPSPRPNMMYEWRGFGYPANGWRYSKETMARLDKDGRVWYPTLADGQLDTSKRPRLKRYLAEMAGGVRGNVWTDVPPVNSQADDRQGYPTQKPIALLDRIIQASTNKGDVILDPFCGCGTTIEAAERAGREWIGIDITHHALDVVEGRLKKRHPSTKYIVKGRPADLESALRLARDMPYEFQWWANWMLGVQGYRQHKKGADKGIDGIIQFYNPPHGAGQVIVSVKAGQNIAPKMIDELAGTLLGQNAQMGVFVCAKPPTNEMKQRAVGKGFVLIGGKSYPVVQVVTAEDLVSARLPKLPRIIEASTLRDTLRTSKSKRHSIPSPQLTLTLPIIGKGSSKHHDIVLSGDLLAELGRTAIG